MFSKFLLASSYFATYTGQDFEFFALFRARLGGRAKSVVGGHFDGLLVTVVMGEAQYRWKLMLYMSAACALCQPCVRNEWDFCRGLVVKLRSTKKNSQTLGVLGISLDLSQLSRNNEIWHQKGMQLHTAKRSKIHLVPQ